VPANLGRRTADVTLDVRGEGDGWHVKRLQRERELQKRKR
jgi:hypothetical protein